MLDSLTINIGSLTIAAFVIAIVGTHLARVADRLADVTVGGSAAQTVFLAIADIFYRSLGWSISDRRLNTEHHNSSKFRELLNNNRSQFNQWEKQ